MVSRKAPAQSFCGNFRKCGLLTIILVTVVF